MDRRFQRLARDLPVMPAVATKVLAMASTGQQVSYRELEDIVSVDPGLTARILKVANSAEYARQREIKDLRSAFTLLGLNTIRSLVLVVAASGMFSQIRTSDFYREHWYHSILTAFLSRTIARRCGHREHADEAFLAGLFHDIGRVVLYLADPERYGSLMRGDTRRGESFRRLERETFGTDHHELAAALFEEWRFPSLYVDTAREHNTANITSPHKTLIVFVTVADILTEQAVTGRSDADRQELLLRLLPHTCLTAPDAAAYTTGLAESLSDDPLFAECLQMYGFTAPNPSAPAER